MSALDEQIAQVRDTTGVIQSATLLIDGFAQRLTDAIAAALANGATEAELAPVKAELTSMVAARVDLARAVAANPGVPGQPVPTPVPNPNPVPNPADPTGSMPQTDPTVAAQDLERRRRQGLP